MGQWQAEIPEEEHPAIARRVRGGETLAQVGASYRTSRQRIHQICQQIDPNAARTGRAVRLAVRRTQRCEQAEVERATRLAALGPCRICYGPIGRLAGAANPITCSPRCAELWVTAALHLSPERHEAQRQSMARGILARGTNGSKRQWAMAVLGNGVPPNRRYLVPGSRAAKALEEIEALREAAAASP